MINRQQLNLVQHSERLEPLRVDLRGLDQTSALLSHDDQLKALRPLELARQREPLQLTQPRQFQLSSGGGDRLQL